MNEKADEPYETLIRGYYFGTFSFRTRRKTAERNRSHVEASLTAVCYKGTFQVYPL